MLTSPVEPETDFLPQNDLGVESEEENLETGISPIHSRIDIQGKDVELYVLPGLD